MEGDNVLRDYLLPMKPANLRQIQQTFSFSCLSLAHVLPAPAAAIWRLTVPQLSTTNFEPPGTCSGLQWPLEAPLTDVSLLAQRHHIAEHRSCSTGSLHPA